MLRYRQDQQVKEVPISGSVSTVSNNNSISSSAARKTPSSSPLHIRFLLEIGLFVLFLICLREWKIEQGVVTELSSINDDLAKELQTLQTLLQADAKEETTSVAVSNKEVVDDRLERTDEELQASKKTITELEYAAKQRNKAIIRMKQALTDLAKSECERRFPSGPAHVSLRTSEGDMEIEMAPCNLMPVVTMYFLKQVQDGFWDKMSFFRAESHVLQATDMRVDGSRQPRDKSRSIPFQEYSDQYVHHKYTLGIAGRPGGPDFYINMSENIKIHGPGGQGHNYQGDPESDSCFAKLVRGQNVADRIQQLPFKREGGLHILQMPVEIISMKIIEA